MLFLVRIWCVFNSIPFSATCPANFILFELNVIKILGKRKTLKLHSRSFSPVSCCFLPGLSSLYSKRENATVKVQVKLFVNVIVGCCEHGNEHLASVDGGEFVD
jgi:hypothetical protein